MDEGRRMKLFLLFVCLSSINALLEIPFIRNFVSTLARKQIIDRGNRIGIDWANNVRENMSHRGEMEKIANSQFGGVSSFEDKERYPHYYLEKFHAYEEGNLSWQCASEVESAALVVHSPIFDPENLTKDGDDILRHSFHMKCKESLSENPSHRDIKNVLDIGCSTGISTRKILQEYSTVEKVIGIDLSPHFLSLAQYELNNRFPSLLSKIQYKWASGENFSDSDYNTQYDMVSICLVCHELPEAISRDIFTKTHDHLLKPGGVLCVMDIDPDSAFFVKFMQNPVAFSGFASTEPHLKSYIGMDIQQALRDAGFYKVVQKNNSPRHRTLVAFKGAECS